MKFHPVREVDLPPATRAFYARMLGQLADADVPVLVGGAYALARYTGITRFTKDLDIFVRRADCDRALTALAAAGCATATPFPHWLAKAAHGDELVDVIFSSGNGVAQVDDLWFEFAVDGVVAGVPVQLCPAEEMIWSKAFIMERERFDGADVIHLLQAQADRLDWMRLIARFGAYWRVLFSHLVIFGFVYPAERHLIPDWVMRDLTNRLIEDGADDPAADGVCQGTLLSREQYLVDVEQWAYRDARLLPRGLMTALEAAVWTAAIDSPERHGEVGNACCTSTVECLPAGDSAD